jgi:hypothetical protein
MEIRLKDIPAHAHKDLDRNRERTGAHKCA